LPVRQPFHPVLAAPSSMPDEHPSLLSVPSPPSASVSLLAYYDPPTTEIYTLSLHDALPISIVGVVAGGPADAAGLLPVDACDHVDRKSTRLNSSHGSISYAVFCLKKKKLTNSGRTRTQSPPTRRRRHRPRNRHPVRARSARA